MRKSLLIGAPLSIGVALFLLNVIAGRWNNPQFEKWSRQQTYSYKRNDVEVTLTCDCPTSLVEPHSAVATLVFALRKRETPHQPSAPQASPTATPNPSSPENINSTAASEKQSSKPKAPEHIYAWVDAIDASVEWADKYASEDLGEVDASGAVGTRQFYLKVTPRPSSRAIVSIHLSPATPGENLTTNLAEFTWSPATHPSFLIAITPFIYLLLVVLAAFAVLLAIDRRYRQIRGRTEQQVREARSRAADTSDETHLAWEIARIKLEAYFDRNLLQVNLVFWAAVFVISIGFGFVMSGVLLSFRNPKDFSTAALTACSGVLTQFIGATVMVIYKSTMLQANEFMNVLERINTVGMAVRELDRIPDTEVKKIAVRAQVVELLLSAGRRAVTTRSEATHHE